MAKARNASLSRGLRGKREASGQGRLWPAVNDGSLSGAEDTA